MHGQDEQVDFYRHCEINGHKVKGSGIGAGLYCSYSIYMYAFVFFNSRHSTAEVHGQIKQSNLYHNCEIYSRIRGSGKRTRLCGYIVSLDKLYK